MGRSATAILYYGYVWTAEGRFPWQSDDSDQDIDDGAEDRYLRLAGYDWTLASSASALKQATCDLVCHGDTDHAPLYGVAVKCTLTRAWIGTPRKIDPAAMIPRPEWAEALRIYCEHMQIDPGDQEPGWHLVSEYG